MSEKSRVSLGLVLSLLAIIATLAVGWGKFDSRADASEKRQDRTETTQTDLIQRVTRVEEDFKAIRESQIRTETDVHELRQATIGGGGPFRGSTPEHGH